MLERYLDGDIPSVAELERTLACGIAEATVFPVVCGSATGPIAVDRLADFITELGPAPNDRPSTVVAAGDQIVEVASDVSGDPLAFVFKTIADPYVGQISLMRVRSGTLKPETMLSNSRSGSDEKLMKIATMIGKETELVTSAPAGDIVAVAKLSDTNTGDTLAPKNKPVSLPPIDRPTPVLRPSTTSSMIRCAASSWSVWMRIATCWRLACITRSRTCGRTARWRATCAARTRPARPHRRRTSPIATTRAGSANGWSARPSRPRSTTGVGSSKGCTRWSCRRIFRGPPFSRLSATRYEPTWIPPCANNCARCRSRKRQRRSWCCSPPSRPCLRRMPDVTTSPGCAHFVVGRCLHGGAHRHLRQYARPSQRPVR